MVKMIPLIDSGEDNQEDSEEDNAVTCLKCGIR